MTATMEPEHGVGPALSRVVEQPLDLLDLWLLHGLQQLGLRPPPALLWTGRLCFFLALVCAVSWFSAPACRSLARRLERLGQMALPSALARNARTVRLLVLLLGLYLVADWALQHTDHGRLLSGALFIAAAIVGTRSASRVAQSILLVTLERAAGPQDDPQRGNDPESAARRDWLRLGVSALAQKIATLVVWLSGLVIVLDHFGQSVSSVVTALGVGSLAIGLASQQALSNMIAGLVLLLDRPFRVGDRVRLPNSEPGDVEEIGMRSTNIRLADGTLLVVPNSDLVSSRVVNYSRADTIRCEVRFQAPPTLDLARLGPALEALAAAAPGVLETPPPRLSLLGLADKLDLSLGFAVPPHASAPQIEERLRRQVLQQLQRLHPAPTPAQPVQTPSAAAPAPPQPAAQSGPVPTPAPRRPKHR